MTTQCYAITHAHPAARTPEVIHRTESTIRSYLDWYMREWNADRFLAAGSLTIAPCGEHGA